MFTEYPIKLVNNHLVIDDRQHLLIDTGSPFSFHASGTMKLCGEEIAVRTSIPETTSSYLSEKVGAQIEGILGMDMINRYPLLVDVKNKFIFLDDDAIYDRKCQGLAKGLSAANFYVGISIMVNNKKAKMIVDTGAHISYIHHTFTDGLKVESTEKDFSPYIGEFQTDTYMCKVNLLEEGFSYEQTFGNLPSVIGSAVSMLGIDGIIGIDLFKRYRLQLRNGCLFIPPQGI
ncbi:MAG: retropepsin-like domain-containing protein [Prevotella sp.]|nr:retropepsin-like domain-containing protein [Prevotella sp.]